MALLPVHGVHRQTSTECPSTDTRRTLNIIRWTLDGYLTDNRHSTLDTRHSVGLVVLYMAYLIWRDNQGVWKQYILKTEILGPETELQPTENDHKERILD